MSVKVNSVGRRPRNGQRTTTNMSGALVAWGAEPPRWVILLASACDADNQRVVGDRLGKTASYVSRLINNSYPGDMAEVALAHRISSAVEAAYRRGDMIEKRRRMMADWADFLSGRALGGDVVSLRGG